PVEPRTDLRTEAHWGLTWEKRNRKGGMDHHAPAFSGYSTDWTLTYSNVSTAKTLSFGLHPVRFSKADLKWSSSSLSVDAKSAASMASMVSSIAMPLR